MASELRHSWPVSALRTAFIAPFFIAGILSIIFTQVVGVLVFRHNPVQKQAAISLTKQHFLVLITFVSKIASPCKLSVTYDATSLPSSDSFRVDSLGNLVSSLSPNSVVISNHQIYTDWLFIWFLTYSSHLADSIFVILKDLSKVPILGYGMKNYNFMFLSRKWEKDKINLTNQLLAIDANARGMGPSNGVKHVASLNTSVAEEKIHHWPEGKVSKQIWPYVLVLFPEGTVPSVRTRGKSNEYTTFKKLPAMRHVLLPRVRGLFLVLRKLRNTVEVVYDVTIGYSGLVAGQIGEEEYSLKRMYFLGYGPSKVNYHVRGFKISDIPLGEETEDVDDASEEDMQKFEDWLLKVWYEKDELMDAFYKYGKFVDPKDPSNEAYTNNTVEADFKLRNFLEIVGPFSTVIASLLILRLLYFFLKKALGY
ncbi:acyltransferase-domain-containing protein [Scheffersomyces xylosifermentans]|uniref:acyltransferase-domain-containing protein n=1 Tax=Scheffersomyces xylosifermentans TaxID=1304137 RepID=UPI00315D08E9